MSLLLLGLLANAQPDNNNIKKLTGEINIDWLNVVGKLTLAKQLDWKFKKDQGFNNTSSSARKQSILSGSWNFYAVDTLFHIAEGEKVELPYHFSSSRNYNSVWYVTKFAVDKMDKKIRLRE